MYCSPDPVNVTPFIDTSSGTASSVYSWPGRHVGDVQPGELHSTSVSLTTRACTSSIPKRHLTSPRSWNARPVIVTAVLPVNGPPCGKIWRTPHAHPEKCEWPRVSP